MQSKKEVHTPQGVSCRRGPATLPTALGLARKGPTMGPGSPGHLFLCWLWPSSCRTPGLPWVITTMPADDSCRPHVGRVVRDMRTLPHQGGPQWYRGSRGGIRSAREPPGIWSAREGPGGGGRHGGQALPCSTALWGHKARKNCIVQERKGASWPRAPSLGRLPPRRCSGNRLRIGAGAPALTVPPLSTCTNHSQRGSASLLSDRS